MPLSIPQYILRVGLSYNVPTEKDAKGQPIVEDAHVKKMNTLKILSYIPIVAGLAAFIFTNMPANEYLRAGMTDRTFRNVTITRVIIGTLAFGALLFLVDVILTVAKLVFCRPQQEKGKKDQESRNIKPNPITQTPPGYVFNQVRKIQIDQENTDPRTDLENRDPETEEVKKKEKVVLTV